MFVGSLLAASLLLSLMGVSLAALFSSSIVSERELKASSLVLMYNKDLSQCYLFDPQTNDLLYLALKVNEGQYKLSTVSRRSVINPPSGADPPRPTKISQIILRIF